MTVSQSERAYQAIRRMIVRLELAPGAVLREESTAAPARHRPHPDP